MPLRLLLTLCGLALVVAGDRARAQTDPAPTTGILEDRVDTLLREWSARTGKVKSLYAEFTRVTFDKVWQQTTKDDGSARYLHPNKARLDVTGERAESYVLTGAGEIWEYKPPIKQITIYQLPPDMVQQDNIQDGPLPFLFGTEPAKAKARYFLKIVEETDAMVHLLINPKLQEDQQNFTSAQLWLSKETFLPNKLMFLEPNGNEVSYEFKGVWTNIEINTADFVPQTLPAPWRVIRKQVADKDDAADGKLRR